MENGNDLEGKEVYDVILLQDANKAYQQTDHVNKISIVKERRQIRRKTFLGTSSLLTFTKDKEKLFLAISNHDVEAVEVLLKGGARVNICDDKLRTPLHIAAASADESIVRLLLKYKADPNRRDIVGNTCLHLAACNCSIPIVTLLLQNGAEVETLDGTGKNPMQLAAGRLRCIKQNKSYSDGDLKREILSVLSLMQIYSRRKEMESMVMKLDEISSRLESTALKGDIEAVGELLGDLMHLSIGDG